jgi:rhomboid protease GluP
MKEYRPYVTYGVLTACAVIHILIVFSGFENLNEAAILMGAYYKAFILAGEWWRLLTAGLVHASLIHLFMNGLALSTLGGVMERTLGRLKYAAVLAGSVIGGSLFLFCAKGNQMAVGISGGLYGLMAGYTYLILRAGGGKNPSVKAALIRTYAINLMINFLPGVSFSSHLGGFLTGLFLTALLTQDTSGMKKHILTAGVLYFIFLGIFIPRSAYILQDEEYFLTDLRVLSAEKKFGLKRHAEKMAENLDVLYNNDGFLTESLKGS